MTTILVPILDYFQEQLKAKFLKNPERTYLGPFYPNLGKNEFSWKKELCQFLDIPIIYHCAKNQKKNCRAISEENTKLTDRQTDDIDFIRPYIGKFLGIICLIHTQNCSKLNLCPSP